MNKIKKFFIKRKVNKARQNLEKRHGKNPLPTKIGAIPDDIEIFPINDLW